MKPLRHLPATATIAQMRREFGVTARALRFYEEQGLLAPVRGQQGRAYSHRDRVRLKLTLDGRRAGLSLREIRELLDVYDKEGARAQREKALPRLRLQVLALETRRGQLDAAIEALRTAAARLDQANISPSAR